MEKVQIYSGMGYAVQINEVANSLRWMMQGLEVPRAAMKLNVINLTEDVRRYILKEEGRDIPNTFGIIINFLKEDDYGSKQGLLNLDVIVAMDGFPINDMQDAATYMANKKPYEIVYLMIIRDGEFKLLSYKLDKLEIPMKFYDKDDVSRSPSNTEEEDEEELEELEELSPLDELELEEEDK
jgi:S1-C subfamily serine protease